eukprot:TRINITY_DN3564_c0_g1_i3.p1 TRINITY_DN3564_c0_g1~~TRINITY_DN3564_c0_g1_i3.p1  ORF type:complete len:226 (-),score=26.45 TRINITY_DN3564_c0_g1_i3:696-1373(-)
MARFDSEEPEESYSDNLHQSYIRGISIFSKQERIAASSNNNSPYTYNPSHKREGAPLPEARPKKMQNTNGRGTRNIAGSPPNTNGPVETITIPAASIPPMSNFQPTPVPQLPSIQPPISAPVPQPINTNPLPTPRVGVRTIDKAPMWRGTINWSQFIPQNSANPNTSRTMCSLCIFPYNSPDETKTRTMSMEWSSHDLQVIDLPLRNDELNTFARLDFFFFFMPL